MESDHLEPKAGDFTWLQMLDDRCGRLLELRTRILRRGDEKAYHDIRVATRRLQELVAFLNPFLPQRRARRVWRRARKIRRAVSDTRNADVMRTVADGLRSNLERDQARILQELCASCLPAPSRRIPRRLPEAGKRIASLRKRFREPAPRPLTQRAEQMLAERLARLEKARRAAADASPERMHRLRIAVKHYRYLLELLAPLGLAGAHAAIPKARDAQHILGKLHDLDMLQEILARRGSSKEVRRILVRERQRRLKESRRAMAAMPVIAVRWIRPARRAKR